MHQRKGQLRDGSKDDTTTELKSEAQVVNKLLHWDQIEEWRRDNEYIRTGYVPSHKSFRTVFRSMGFVHNETGNVYTHAIPAVCIIVILFLLVTYELWPWQWPFVVFGTGCASCLGLSATFHLMKSHSRRIQRVGNKLDYLGICVLIASSTVAVMGYSFDDSPGHFLLYSAITLSLGLACSVVSLTDQFMTPAWRPTRAVMYVVYGVSGGLPILGGIELYGYQETALRSGIHWLYLEGALYIGGAIVYAARMPEKWAPGRFDIWGHSHQIFHCFVLAGAWSHFKGLCQAYDYSLVRAALL